MVITANNIDHLAVMCNKVIIKEQRSHKNALLQHLVIFVRFFLYRPDVCALK